MQPIGMLLFEIRRILICIRYGEDGRFIEQITYQGNARRVALVIESIRHDHTRVSC